MTHLPVYICSLLLSTYVHVIVVTQARVRCLICTHDAQGRVRGHTGNARVPVLQ